MRLRAKLRQAAATTDDSSDVESGDVLVDKSVSAVVETVTTATGTGRPRRQAAITATQKITQTARKEDEEDRQDIEGVCEEGNHSQVDSTLGKGKKRRGRQSSRDDTEHLPLSPSKISNVESSRKRRRA